MDKSDPVIYGIWEPVRYKFKYLPVHMALLHTGRVFAFGGSGNDPKFLQSPHPSEIFEPGSIDGNDGQIYEVPNECIQGDIFCAGHTFLPDGKLLAVGGTFKYDNAFVGITIPPFRGLDHCYLFDPISMKWKRLANMKYSRWYPTCILNSDGSVIVMAGLTRNFPWAFLNKLEMMGNTGQWKECHGADIWLPLYPRLHLLPTGEIFYAGSFNTHYTFPFSVKAFPSSTLNPETGKWKKIGNPQNVNREEGTTVMLPLLPPKYDTKVLLIGGGTPQGKDAISNVEIIDFSDSEPKYTPYGNLIHPRYYVYPVILPDKSVLVLGGKVGQKGHLHVNSTHHFHTEHQEGEVPHHPQSVMEPELLDPFSNQWHPMADMRVDRLYHSNALLLPDGRVMTAGSNPERTMNELRIEIYQPPYLFRGQRPEIRICDAHMKYGDKLQILVNSSYEIDEICLLRPTSTTHCVNTEQRYIGLEFERKSDTILVTSIPNNPNLAPPGYYMLFIVDSRGVPSVAHFIQIVYNLIS